MMMMMMTMMIQLNSLELIVVVTLGFLNKCGYIVFYRAKSEGTI